MISSSTQYFKCLRTLVWYYTSWGSNWIVNILMVIDSVPIPVTVIQMLVCSGIHKLKTSISKYSAKNNDLCLQVVRVAEAGAGHGL